MTISNEAVEAAARAIYATEAQPIYDEVKEEFTGHRPWEWLTERSWYAYRDKARLTLEAAAPIIKAAALEEAASLFAARLPNGTGNGRAYNSYQVADMLRARAAAERGEG